MTFIVPSDAETLKFRTSLTDPLQGRVGEGGGGIKRDDDEVRTRFDEIEDPSIGHIRSLARLGAA